MRGDQGNSRQDWSQAEGAYPSPYEEANGPNSKVPGGTGNKHFRQVGDEDSQTPHRCRPERAILETANEDSSTGRRFYRD